ncbi:MAG: hypothetical protein Q8S03_10125 [Brevundimonas sp.]|uniref:hypothetical protein n=1 Tax=Brevundimonas sp. TaxID=1871086 RepID=UPI002733D4B8|nr:hypothetical protein [Brevundimonas sp.]MDP3405035.1 hypothetical protein [Brevundimonas sp.]
MTVAELIEALAAYPQDTPVVVMGDSDGTHWSPPALDPDRMSPTGDGWFISGADHADATPVVRL